MKDGPTISAVAALIGDPARSNMLTALLDGRALTVSELAQVAGVALPTASGHLSRLLTAGLLSAERQGRHRYYRLSGPDVAQVLEALMGLAERTVSVPVRTGPSDSALRSARVCYDHLAGERGVALFERLVARGLIGANALTVEGAAFFTRLGIGVEALTKARRPMCRACLDWSERRDHLGGALGAAILTHILNEGWAQRGPGRVVSFSGDGLSRFEAAFAP